MVQTTARFGWKCSAVGETRTPKELLPLVPETNASTNFATTAFYFINISIPVLFCQTIFGTIFLCLE